MRYINLHENSNWKNLQVAAEINTINEDENEENGAQWLNGNDEEVSLLVETPEVDTSNDFALDYSYEEGELDFTAPSYITVWSDRADGKYTMFITDGENVSEEWYDRGIKTMDSLENISQLGANGAAFIDFSNYHGLPLISYESLFAYSDAKTICGLTNIGFRKCRNFSNMFLDSKVTKVELNGLSLECGNRLTKYQYNLNGMFKNCSDLQTVTLQDFISTKANGNGAILQVQEMFANCTSLKSIDIQTHIPDFVFKNKWSCLSHESLFEHCYHLKSYDGLLNNIAHSTSISKMYKSCSIIKSISLTGTNNGFYHQKPNKKSEIIKLDTTRFPNGCINFLTNAQDAFSDCALLEDVKLPLILPTYETVDISDNKLLTLNCDYMFNSCKSLKVVTMDFDINNRINSMEGMFKDCISLTHITFNYYEHDDDDKLLDYALTNTKAMFKGCINLQSNRIPLLFMKNVTNMCAMFYGCTSLTYFENDNQYWDLSSVVDANCMFANCRNLQCAYLSSLNNVQSDGTLVDVSGLFGGCTNLQTVYLDSFVVPTANEKAIQEHMQDMFHNCDNLTTIYLPNEEVARWLYDLRGFLGIANSVNFVYSPHSYDHRIFYDSYIKKYIVP